MKFTMSIAMSPLDELTELARTAEENGFSSVALPDSILYPENPTGTYMYTADGNRFWNEGTPWVDPFIAAAAMASVTTHLRFYTQVLKLNPRNPVLLARQLQSVAWMTNNRFGLGVGLGWMLEESEWCGAPFDNRGKRCEESIEIFRLILGGGMVEYHGEFYSFDKMLMSPAPTEPMPIYYGSHTEPGLRRAARMCDGWTSAMIKFDELQSVIERLDALRADYGRSDVPFEIQAVCVDRFGLDGYRDQAAIGVTDAVVVPWLFYGVGFDGTLEAKKDGIKRFADDIIAKL
ncbi:TIGR03619 family F420-dependent LLM class oxidoreductase [Antrihabitans stalactiti]|uniref:TIGR03619 family F420-dependent LLM class oxidoreductase n=1 Tax=Antrihabitans stalactiti TaxID=2584121 RepID=A0A848K7E3_9NOCA|nr:TIGR03619 family F420-dependent LLM class oxidoreductase [Antrihabitans stalactiti]NMN94289.1 TIGR03619 family F420-dependent LLM class oxidoreductase [Antrihabitans stalactiti]